MGTFVVSLDFELCWGVRDRDASSLMRYRDNLVGERIAVDTLLRCFTNRGIRATWATVGALFCASREEFLRVMPARKPHYSRAQLSPYDALDEIGTNEASDPLHFAPSLVRKIALASGQELATHTFSHFYCLEHGQTEDDFDADLEVAQHLAEPFGGVRSLVFPRNQYNASYRRVLAKRGIRSYRSNGTHWAYAATMAQRLHRRAARLVDAYVPIAGAHAHVIRQDEHGLTDVPASAFLRPYSPRLQQIDGIRVARIKHAMTRTAQTSRTFHLWWHPHNFGTHLRENMAILDVLLDHFDMLRRSYHFESASMGDLAKG